MDRIPVNVQRHIAGFATEVGVQVRSGGRFLGRERDLPDEQKKCVCGICVRTRNQPREKCTLFRDGDVTLVQRQQTELCRPVCMSRSPLRMLGRFIGHLLSRLSKQATSPIHRLMLTLQRDERRAERSASFHISISVQGDLSWRRGPGTGASILYDPRKRPR